MVMRPACTSRFRMTPRLVLVDGLTGQPATRPELVGCHGPGARHHPMIEQLVADNALGIDWRRDE